jgi:hypothetical protein
MREGLHKAETGAQENDRKKLNLTPDSGNLIENPVVAQLLTKRPFLYRTGRFNAVFTIAPVVPPTTRSSK